MPTSDVTPNAAFFIKFWSGQSQEDIAAKHRISIGLIRKCLRGERITQNRMEHTAEKTKHAISELTLVRPESAIPNDAAYFEMLKYGAYIDNNRRRSGEVVWLTEKIELKSSRKRLEFTGKIINQMGQTFRVTAAKRQDYFSVTATSNTGGPGFDAVYSFRKGDVICGTWSGFRNHVATRIAIYRQFLSARPLTLGELQQLCQEFPIECYDEASNFDVEAKL